MPTPQTFNLEANESGIWQMESTVDLIPGQHTVVVTDDRGNTDESILYLAQDNVPVLSSGQSIAGDASLPWTIFVLIAVAGILLAMNIRQTLKTGFLNNWRNNRTKMLRDLGIFACLFIAFLICVYIYSQRAAWFGGDNKQNQATYVLAINGAVIDPLSRQGVPGVDLTYENTTIKTGVSGEYVFTNLVSSKGITVTHPLLTRALRFLPQKQDATKPVPLFFDAAAYNQIIRIANLEATGRYAEIYQNYLAEEVKSQLNEANFIKQYQSIFNVANLVDQTLDITDTDMADKWVGEISGVTFNQVLTVQVTANDQKATYRLVKQKNQWQLVW